MIFAVRHWDWNNDLVAVEEEIRSIQCDSLFWGDCMYNHPRKDYFYNFAVINCIIKTDKVVRCSMGDKELQIGCVYEDKKVSYEWLYGKI